MQKVELKQKYSDKEYNAKLFINKHSVQQQQNLSRVFNGEERSESGHVSHDHEDT